MLRQLSIVEVRDHMAGVFCALNFPVTQLCELWLLHDAQLLPMFFE